MINPNLHRQQLLDELIDLAQRVSLFLHFPALGLPRVLVDPEHVLGVLLDLSEVVGAGLVGFVVHSVLLLLGEVFVDQVQGDQDHVGFPVYLQLGNGDEVLYGELGKVGFLGFGVENAGVLLGLVLLVLEREVLHH